MKNPFRKGDKVRYTGPRNDHYGLIPGSIYTVAEDNVDWVRLINPNKLPYEPCYISGWIPEKFERVENQVVVEVGDIISIKFDVRL